MSDLYENKAYSYGHFNSIEHKQPMYKGETVLLVVYGILAVNLFSQLQSQGQVQPALCILWQQVSTHMVRWCRFIIHE